MATGEAGVTVVGRILRCKGRSGVQERRHDLDEDRLLELQLLQRERDSIVQVSPVSHGSDVM